MYITTISRVMLDQWHVIYFGKINDPEKQVDVRSSQSYIICYYSSNVPSVRYGRAYKSDRTQFYKYYKMYFYHSGASLYVKRAKPNISK